MCPQEINLSSDARLWLKHFLMGLLVKSDFFRVFTGGSCVKMKQNLLQELLYY